MVMCLHNTCTQDINGKNMKRILIIILLFECLCTFAQQDTLNYKVTSKYKNGFKRTNLIELTDGYIENAFYEDGKHYYWTKILDADKKVEWLYEFQYAEENNFSSQLSIKVKHASYSNTKHFSSNSYSNYTMSTITTMTTNSDIPKYTHEKTIIVKNNGYVVYQYVAGHLWWTYYYNKDGIIQYKTDNEKKWTYKLDGDLMTETTPTGEQKKYKIDDKGYGIIQDDVELTTWALSDLGRIKCYLSLPKLKE